MLYRGTYSVTTTSATTDGCGSHCTCPNCGYSFDCGSSNTYTVALSSDTFGFRDSAPPVIVAERAPWPKPLSSPVQFWQTPQFHQRTRYGRELRHRGTFRNFHK